MTEVLQVLTDAPDKKICLPVQLFYAKINGTEKVRIFFWGKVHGCWIAGKEGSKHWPYHVIFLLVFLQGNL